MVRRTVLLLLAAAGITTASQPTPHWSDATARVVLDNGLTVLMLQRGDLPLHAAAVDVGAFARWRGRFPSSG